jgi:hypothetical protein
MPDNAGIPDYFLAPADEQFYAGIGRVCALVSLLESRLLDLLWSLSDEPQSAHLNDAPAKLIKLCESAAETNASPDLLEDVKAALDSVRRLRDERNALVHSVWAQPEWGWRPDIHAKPGSEEPHIFYRTDEESIQSVIDKLVTLIEQLDRLQQRGHTQKGLRLIHGEAADERSLENLGLKTHS